MRRSASALLTAVLLLAGCARTLGGEDYGSDAYHDLSTDGVHHPTAPPPLTLHRPEGDVELAAWTYCFSNGSSSACADGARPKRPPRTAADGLVTFTFPLRGWTFDATFRPPGPYRDCEPVLRTAVTSRGDGTFEVPAIGAPGSWQVDISGNGDAGNDLYTTFVWSAASASTVPPVAHGEAGLLGPPSVYEDKELEAYGPSLYLTGLDDEPADVSADLVLSDGAATATYPLLPDGEDSCRDGAVSFMGEHPNEPLELPDLGEPPYGYEVRLTMDGVEYVGTGSWPEDLTPPSSNSLALTWSPALPAWDGAP